jgi:hypothetical protein
MLLAQLFKTILHLCAGAAHLYATIQIDFALAGAPLSRLDVDLVASITAMY